MRFDLGTLDSGERSLPFGLLVSVLFSFLITSPGEEGAVYVLFFHLYVYFAHISFCPFSLPLGERLAAAVIVALPGLFY